MNVVRPGWLAALAVATACSSGSEFLGREPRPPTDEGAWAELRDGATRGGKLYDGLAMNAFASAVYQSPDVRQARVERVATWKALANEERDRLLAAEREEASRYDEFLVSIFTPDRTANDLDTTRSVWRVALVVAGEPDRYPESIHLIRVDAMLQQLYPNIGHFDSTYAVRFARRDPLQGRPFVLRLAGAKGRLDLQY